jgi:hypothetical protein
MLVHPPSTMIVCPVMCFAFGDTRNKAVAAISATVAGLPIGVIVDQIRAYSISSCVRSVSVDHQVLRQHLQSGFTHAIGCEIFVGLVAGYRRHE